MSTSIEEEIIALVSRGIFPSLPPVVIVFQSIKNIEFEWLLKEVNTIIKQIYNIIIVSRSDCCLGG